MKRKAEKPTAFGKAAAEEFARITGALVGKVRPRETSEELVALKEYRNLGGRVRRVSENRFDIAGEVYDLEGLKQQITKLKQKNK